MPELPEVETVRRVLHARIVGRRVTEASLLRRDVLVIPGDPAAGFARLRTPPPVPLDIRPFHLLVGSTIAGVERCGKQLVLRTSPAAADAAPSLAVHLGMSGRLALSDSAPDAAVLQPHTHAWWVFEDATTLAFVDPRRFGGLWWFPDDQSHHAHRWATLGPDALTLTADELGAALAGSRRPIKAALLDQRCIAGIGNIYADEALHQACINPLRPAEALRPEELDALALAIPGILAEAVAAGGSTVRDYSGPDGARGGFQIRHAVYGRAGEACTRCGERLVSGQVAQRTTVWCANCQVDRPASPSNSTGFPHHSSGESPGVRRNDGAIGQQGRAFRPERFCITERE